MGNLKRVPSSCSMDSFSSCSSSQSRRSNVRNRIVIQRRSDAWRSELITQLGELDEQQLSEIRAAAGSFDVEPRNRNLIEKMKFSTELELLSLDGTEQSKPHFLRAPLPEHETKASL